MTRADRWWRTLAPLPVPMHGHRVLHELRRRVQGPLLPQWVARCQHLGHARAAGVRRGALQGLATALDEAPQPALPPGELDLAGLRAALPLIDWRLPTATPLQVYTAHYLEWTEPLAAGAAAQAHGPHGGWLSASLAAWSAQAPLAVKAWEPYVRARRVLAGLRAAARLVDQPVQPTLLAIAAAAAVDLDLLLEQHLRGNHLLADLLGLAAAEAAFGGDGRAARALQAEWDRQSVPDGAHGEMSAMYHAQLAEDLLTVVALGDVTGALAQRAQRAVGWLAAVRHPDGRVPGFGDSDPDAVDAMPLLRLALRSAPAGVTDPVRSAWTARQSGGHFAVVHTAPVACTEQPGHAHDDALAVEWSHGGVRVVAEAGLGGYEGDPLRATNRSAASHSTVQVPNRPGVELWGAFRLGARGKVEAVRAGSTAGWQWVSAEFSWPDGRLRHRRLVALGPAGQLALCDSLLGADAALPGAIARLIAAPGVTLDSSGARLPDGRRLALTATVAVQVAEGVRFSQRVAKGPGPEWRYSVGPTPVWLCAGGQADDLDVVRSALAAI